MMPLETQKPDVSVSDGLVDVEVANGADVNAGSTTDAAVTTDTNATLSAKIRGLVKILADVWDDVSNLLRVAVQNTVTIQDGGNVISVDDAGGSITADVTGDVGIDLRANTSVKRYMASLFGGGSTVGGTKVVGVMNPAGGTDVRIYRIRVSIMRSAAGTGTPLRLFRSNNVAGGALIAKADVQALDTDYGDTNLELRNDAPTGTTIGRYIMTIGSDPFGDAAVTGFTDEWLAIDKYDMITLHPGEGLIFDIAKIGDGDDDYNVDIAYEED